MSTLEWFYVGQSKWLNDENQVEDIPEIPNSNKSKTAVLIDEPDI